MRLSDNQCRSHGRKSDIIHYRLNRFAALHQLLTGGAARPAPSGVRTSPSAPADKPAARMNAIPMFGQWTG